MSLRDILKGNRLQIIEKHWQIEPINHGKDYKIVRNGFEYHVLVNLPERVREGEAKPNVSIEIVSSKPGGRLYATYFQRKENGKVTFELEKTEGDEEKPNVTVGGEAELLATSKNGERKYEVKIGDHRYGLPMLINDKDVSNFIEAVKSNPEYEGFILPVSDVTKTTIE